MESLGSSDEIDWGLVQERWARRELRIEDEATLSFRRGVCVARNSKFTQACRVSWDRLGDERSFTLSNTRGRKSIGLCATGFLMRLVGFDVRR